MSKAMPVPDKNVDTMDQTPDEKEAKGSYDQYEIENAGNHLMKAAEVKAKPNLHKKAQEHLKKQHAALADVIEKDNPKKQIRSLADLKAVAKEKNKSGD